MPSSAAVTNPAYGWIVGAAVAKGTIRWIDTDEARAAPGVLAVVTAHVLGPLGKGDRNTVRLLGGPGSITTTRRSPWSSLKPWSRRAAALVRVDYDRAAWRPWTKR